VKFGQIVHNSHSTRDNPKPASGRQQTLAVCSPQVIPRHQLADPALLVAIDEAGERGGQVRERIDGVELASFDERGDGGPVLGPGVVTGEESVLPI